MSEHDEQCALFHWIAIKSIEYPPLKWSFAIPNGTRTSIGVAKRMKAEGVLKGASDIFIPIPCHGYHGLFIEMKDKGGSASPEQRNFIQATQNLGYLSGVCHGWIEAAKMICFYLCISDEGLEG